MFDVFWVLFGVVVVVVVVVCVCVCVRVAWRMYIDKANYTSTDLVCISEYAYKRYTETKMFSVTLDSVRLLCP